MAATAAERNLLFGQLALQIGLIDQSALVAAFHAWARDKTRTLADHLAGRGELEPDQRAAVEALVAVHLKKHGGDTEKSLAALDIDRSTRQSLAAVGDAEIEATLTHVAPASGETGDSDRTATFVVGAATSDGQRFRVLRPHARGALGAVFVALDQELHREVALKQIQDRYADDPTSRARFLLEAEITGGLEHPGIVPVYGLGSYADGRPYYAMRFIRGDSLKDAIAGFHSVEASARDPGARSLELRKLLRRFQDVCNAIDYAHQRGVLHRDLKPGNVMVGKHGESLVVDWGLAKPLGRAELEPELGAGPGERTLVPSSASGSAETLPGSTLGTPAYMSPEQAEGDLQRLGPRSDVYSLGATLYCLLTGRPPFVDEDVGTVLRAVKAGVFPPPRKVDPSIDRALEAVCLKAMALEPEDRYPTPRALAEDVERWMADEPVSARREPRVVRARRWMRRHRTVMTAAAVAIVVAVAGLAAVAAIKSQAARQLSQKNRELERANQQVGRARDQAEGRVDLAIRAIENFRTAVRENLDVRDRPELQGLRKALLRAPLEFYRTLGDDLRAGDDVRPEVRAKLSDAYYHLADLTREIDSQANAIEAYQQAAAILEPLARADPGAIPIRSDLAQTYNDLANLQSRNGQVDAARESYRRAREIRAALVHDQPDDAGRRDALARVDLNIGLLDVQTGRFDEAMVHYQDALKALEQALRDAPGDAKIPGDLASAHRFLGELQSRKGQSAAALESIRKALEIQERLAREQPASLPRRDALAAGYVNAAETLAEMGRVDEALATYRKALTVREALAREHPTNTQVLHDLATTDSGFGQWISSTGRHAEALEAYHKAKDVLESLVRDNPLNSRFRSSLARVLNSVGTTQYAMGEVSKTLETFRAVAAIQERIARDNPTITRYRRDLAGSLYNIGFIQGELGRYEPALASYRESLAIREELARSIPADPWPRHDVASTLGNIAKVLDRTDHAEAALESLRKARAIQEVLVRDHPDVVEFRNYLARTLDNIGGLEADAGRSEAAREALERSLTIREQIARDIPAMLLHQRDLARSHASLGRFHAKLGAIDRAEQSFRRSLAIQDRLIAAHPDEAELRQELGECLLALAELFDGKDRAGASHDQAARAVAVLEPMLAREPGKVEVRTALRRALRARAGALVRLGRSAESVADWSRARDLADRDDRRAADRVDAARAMALAGDHAGARSAAEALEKSGSLAPEILYGLARVYALTSPADRAVALLDRAIAAGYAHDPARRAGLFSDPDLDSLRSRSDFQLLMMDPAFPADPFAP